MQMNYQDALAMVREYGKPDYFVTITANPAWPEIAENLAPGEHAVNRPELVARVFALKLKALLKDLTENGVLGVVVAYCWTIEFQKRGLPHAHILLIMRSEDKPRTPDVVDRVVSAELPDDGDPQQADLFLTVSRSMMHGPCGAVGPNKPCMNDHGVCSKGFPKEFAEETSLPQDQYPVYRRRDNGRCVEKNGVVMDNRWVVPYNPYLLRKYNAHINVHVCTSIRAVKYMYKYIYKGHDRAAIEVAVHDEVQDFIDARYVGPPESCWRLLSFEMHGKSHVVERLPVHLPGRQSVLFDESDPASAVATDQATKLTAYFSLVRDGWRAEGLQDLAAPPLYYFDVPKWYVWSQKTKIWKARQRGRMRSNKVLARMYSVAPQDTDRFYLRMLLLHLPNVEAFVGPSGLKQDEVTTWRSAATAHGLVDDDSEYELSMHEAALTHMPGLLRGFFVQILFHCEPADPNTLWEKFKEELAEDFLRTAISTERGYQAALHDIDQRLHSVGKSIADFQLPEYPDYDAEEFKNRALRQAMAFDPGTEADLSDERVPRLSEEQRAMFDAVMVAVMAPAANPRGNCFYVDGPGGSGKTFLYEALIHTVRGKGMISLACAISGIAGQLLPGGTTAHSLFGLPIDMPKHDATSSIRAQEPRAEVLRRAKLILWDEVSMVPLAALDCVDRLLRDLTGDNRPFGGKVLILGGDFRQLLPVVPGANEPELVANTVLKHYSMQ